MRSKLGMSFSRADAGPVAGVRPGTSPWPDEGATTSALNRQLDRFVAHHDPCGGSPAPYLSYGTMGIGAGLGAAVFFGLLHGVSVTLLLAAAVAAVAGFVAAGLIRKLTTGTERHRLLDDTLIAGGAVALVAWSLGDPVGGLLDVFAIGLGVFLVFGRFGCLAAGCCHGRPAPVGVRYGLERAPAPCLAGVRLYPIQLVEAGWLALVTAAAAALLARNAARPGGAAWCWLLAYASGRFVLDLGRGDGDGRRDATLTRAQWLCLGIFAARVAYEVVLAPGGATPARGHLVACGAATALVVIAWLSRRLWLDLAQPPLTLRNIGRWGARLDLLERAAGEARGNGSRLDADASGAGVDLELALQIDPADDGGELRAYAIGRAAATPSAEESFALAGLITARLPHHHLLHVGIDRVGVFRLWTLIVEPDGTPGVDGDDPVRFVLYRARAFAAVARRLYRPFAAAGPPASGISSSPRVAPLTSLRPTVAARPTTAPPPTVAAPLPPPPQPAQPSLSFDLRDVQLHRPEPRAGEPPSPWTAHPGQGPAPEKALGALEDIP